MTKTKNKKTFVLDTNVILHDYRSIYNFEDNDIVIPITVLEELDKFKRGNDQINYHAREFVRELDQISGSDFFLKGAPLGKGRGRLFIQTGVPFSPKMNDSFSEDIPDHRILAIAEYITEKRRRKGRFGVERYEFEDESEVSGNFGRGLQDRSGEGLGSVVKQVYRDKRGFLSRVDRKALRKRGGRSSGRDVFPEGRN